MTGIEKAIAAAGNQTRLAEMLGVSRNSISLWKGQGWVPLPRAREIELLYGIGRSELAKPEIVEGMLGK